MIFETSTNVEVKIPPCVFHQLCNLRLKESRIAPVEMLFLRELLMTAFKEIFPQIVFNFTIRSQEKEKIKKGSRKLEKMFYS